MDRVANVKVYGLQESLVASGYPMATDISKLDPNFKRGVKLGNTPIGSGHSTYLCGITVQADLTCSQAMHMQILRYHFFDVVSSMSKMHRLTKMDIKTQVNEYVTPETIQHLEQLVVAYNEDTSKENYLKVIYNCPVGLELTFRFTTNYLQLKTIYNQRKNHRLPEWKEFVSWMLTLPAFSDLTGITQ